MPTQVQIPHFQDVYPNSSGYSFLYEMSEIGVQSETATLIQPFDSSLFTFDPNTRIISVKTNTLQKEGNYTLQITGRYSFTQTYSVSTTLLVQVLHPCVRNVISPPTIDMDKTKTEMIAVTQEDRFQYYIGTKAQKFQINQWTMSMLASQCGPIVYDATLEGN